MDANQTSELVPVAQAAKELGCAPEFLRRKMKRGTWSDLGDVIKPEPGQVNYSYRIYRPRLDAHIGRHLVQQDGGGERV